MKAFSAFVSKLFTHHPPQMLLYDMDSYQSLLITSSEQIKIKGKAKWKDLIMNF